MQCLRTDLADEIISKAKKYGKINQFYDGKMHQAILQALGAVKDIKILKREKYFSDVYSYDRLILTQVKQMVKGDILIDDNVDNLVWGDYMPILFTSYHNRFEDDTGLNRVNNWEEILKRLRI